MAQQEGKRRSGHTWCGGFPSPTTGPKKTWEARRRLAAVPDGRAPCPASPRPLAATTPRTTWCPSVWRREAPTVGSGGGRCPRPDLEDGSAAVGGGGGRVWELIASVWIEMLFHLATRCEAGFHAKNLCTGGEFITHVRFLLLNRGIGWNFVLGRA